MKTIFAKSLITAIISILICSCSTQKKLDRSYNHVAVDNAPTPRNKQILLNKCLTTFPLESPIITEGNEIITIDTFPPEDDGSGIIGDVLESNCPDALNIDSLTEVIRSGIKPVTIKERHEIHDTIDRGDTYAVRNILAEKKRVEDAKAQVEKEKDLLENQITIKDSEIKSSNRKNWLYLSGYGIIILLYIAKIYITKRLI